MAFVLSLAIVSAGAFLLLRRWLLASFPGLRHRGRLVSGVFFALWLAPFVLRIAARFRFSPLIATLLAPLMVLLMGVLLGSIPMIVFYAARRLLGGKPAPEEAVLAPEVELTDEHPELTATETSASLSGLSRRQLLERGVGLAAYGATGSALGWGLVRGRHAFEIEEVAVRIPGLPRALDGYTIAQISDIHVGAFVQERELREGFEMVRKVRPDLIVATGDLVDFEEGWAGLFARHLVDSPARDGHFTILGNHDYYANADVVTEALERAGARMLVNDGLVVRPKDGGGFALLGVDDMWAWRRGKGPDLWRAIGQVPTDRPRILLAHQPQFFEWSAGHVALQLSGHTHGGQINPGFRPADFFLRYVAGRYQARGSSLWVNRGFGVAGPPSRVGAPPEITKIVLVAA